MDGMHGTQSYLRQPSKHNAAVTHSLFGHNYVSNGVVHEFVYIIEYVTIPIKNTAHISRFTDICWIIIIQNIDYTNYSRVPCTWPVYDIEYRSTFVDNNNYSLSASDV